GPSAADPLAGRPATGALERTPDTTPRVGPRVECAPTRLLIRKEPAGAGLHPRPHAARDAPRRGTGHRAAGRVGADLAGPHRCTDRAGLRRRRGLDLLRRVRAGRAVLLHTAARAGEDGRRDRG